MANNTADAMSPGVPTRPAGFSAACFLRYAASRIPASSVTSTVSASTSGSSR
jgi:hypothetical protein